MLTVTVVYYGYLHDRSAFPGPLLKKKCKWAR